MYRKRLVFFISFFVCLGICVPKFGYAQKSYKKANIDSVKQELKQIEFERILVQANLCKNKKDFEQAIELYHNAQSLNPKSAVVYYELAGIYKQRNKYQDALKYAQKAISLNPSLIAYRYFLAQLYEEKGDYEKHVEQLHIILQQQPQNINLYYSIADVYYNNGNFDKSLHMLSRIEQLFGINEELRYKRFGIYVRQNKQKQAEESIQELLNLYPSEMDYILAAIQLYENNAQYTQAIQLCNTYTNTGNNPADIMYSKARLFAKMDMVDSVTITLIHIFSNTYVTQLQKHEILEKLVLRNTQSPTIFEKRYDIVDKIYEQVPNDEVLHTVLARYYSQNNNPDKALPHLYYAIKHEKSNSSLYNQIIDIETKNKQWDSIISVASTAIILFPNNADMYLALGQAYIKQKQFDLAISTLQDGLDVVYIQKQKRLFYVLLAESLYALNSLESANQTFDKALLIDSTNTHTICVYAYYAALQQKSDKANTLLLQCNNCTQNIDCKLAQALVFSNQRHYEKALEVMNSIETTYDDIKYLELLGDVLFLNNRVDEAENAWKKANDKGSTIDIQLKKVFLQKK